MTPDDNARLRHMLEAARDAMSFAADCSREGLDKDRKLALAIVKCIEIIGEAAARVTAETRDAHPEVPWKAIVGMRNRLIHGYFEIDLDRRAVTRLRQRQCKCRQQHVVVDDLVATDEHLIETCLTKSAKEGGRPVTVGPRQHVRRLAPPQFA